MGEIWRVAARAVTRASSADSASIGGAPADRRYACAMPNIGPLELGIILLIVLIVFGPKRLPGLGRQLGSGMREFKDSLTGKDKDDDEGREEPAVRQQHLDRSAAEPEVVTGEARPQDQPASRADV
jgi:sec-independent protein translocase protein TatA